MLTPFEYQVQAIEALRAAGRAKKRRVILTMLMGAGKTLVSLELMRLCAEQGKRSLFLCDRRMLAHQGLARAEEQGLHAGIIMAGCGRDLEAPNQFASKQTVNSWLDREILDLPEFDLIIQDECHRAVSDEYMRLYARWPNAFRIGLTATPCMGNGDGMGAYYDALIQPIKPSELRSLGRIVGVRAFAPFVPDLKGVKKVDGDYAAKSLSRRMTRENLISDASGWWKKLGENRPSIYFACDIAHALSLVEEFRAAGINAEMLCEDTPDNERDDIRRRSENGELPIVVNVDVLAEGIDWPWISCIGLVRPTRRLRRYLQMVGRGLRAYPGKLDMLLIDHSGCVQYHGFPDLDREWPLSKDDNADKVNQARQEHEPKTMICAQCTAIFSGTNVCPECGYEHVWKKSPKDYAQRNGTLVEISRGDLPADVQEELYQRFWPVCVNMAKKRGRKAGAAAEMFKAKFGIPPWEAGVKPCPKYAEWQEPACIVFADWPRRRV